MFEALAQEALALLRAGRKLEAIQLVRMRTGRDLEGSQRFVEVLERLEALGPEVPARPTEGTLPADIVAEIEGGRKIEAIKMLRERTGMGLKEAKDRVDAHGQTHQPPPVGPTAPYVVESAAGNWLKLVFLALALIAVYLYFTR